MDDGAVHGVLAVGGGSVGTYLWGARKNKGESVFALNPCAGGWIRLGRLHEGRSAVGLDDFGVSLGGIGDQATGGDFVRRLADAAGLAPHLGEPLAHDSGQVLLAVFDCVAFRFRLAVEQVEGLATGAELLECFGVPGHCSGLLAYVGSLVSSVRGQAGDTYLCLARKIENPRRGGGSCFSLVLAG